MTAEQTAINTRALIAAADKLTRTGWQGDAYRFVEGLVVSVLADGYRKLEPVPPKGNGGSLAARKAALAATAEAVHEAKDRRKKRTTEGGAE